MGRQRSFRSKAAHFVSDLTTVFLNPISDKPSKPPPSPPEIASEPTKSPLEPITEKGAVELEVDGPDTSSFAAFMYSLLSSSEDGVNNIKTNGQDGCKAEMGESSCDPVVKENVGKKSLFSKGKHSLGRAIYHVARIGVVRSQGVERKGDHDVTIDGKRDSAFVEEELKVMNSSVEPLPWENIPDTSEPSLLISEKTRGSLYASLPALVQGRKWVLLYSTWRHGISLSTLYRRSMLWPGLSLLVIGDRKGAVFGGLVEAPLKPTSQRKYQGTNNTFVFTNNPGYPIVYRPTGANRYFTLCSTDFLAMGGGGHFALYLDADLLSGSSSVSETFGNSCLAQTEDFQVKEVELWGFVYASQYEEVIALTRKEAPGICRW